MKRLLFASLAALAALSLTVTASSAQAPAKAVAAKAIAIRLMPVPERVAGADAVVAGKVTTIEDKTVSAVLPGTTQKNDYTIAVVKIGDGLLGTKGMTHVKIGFVKPMPVAPGGRPIIRPGGGYGPPQLAIDQEGLFFLQKHPTESFYVMTYGPNSLINKANNDNFDKEVAAAKKSAKLLADPKAGLKSKDADERAETAELLVLRYNSPKPGQTKREDIGADESKLILQGLADGDWSKNFSATEITPQAAFGRLGVTDKDGFSPQDYGKPDAIKKWLKDNAGTFRVKKYVAEKKDDKKDEKKDK